MTIFSIGFQVIFIQDNVLSCSVDATAQLIFSLYLNPTENFWSIHKRKVYGDRHKFATKEDFWQAILTITETKEWIIASIVVLEILSPLSRLDSLKAFTQVVGYCFPPYNTFPIDKMSQISHYYCYFYGKCSYNLYSLSHQFRSLR